MVMVTYYNIYYCVIVGWSVYYFIASFVAIPDLPWNSCGEHYCGIDFVAAKFYFFVSFSDGWWNSDNCWMPGMNTTANNETVAPVEEFWRYIKLLAF